MPKIFPCKTDILTRTERSPIWATGRASGDSYLLGKLDEREAELLGVAKATDVTVERSEHLSLGVARQHALQTAQLLGA